MFLAPLGGLNARRGMDRRSAPIAVSRLDRGLGPEKPIAPGAAIYQSRPSASIRLELGKTAN
jgi:hypothetical protein